MPSGREEIEETPTGELKHPALSISAPLAKHLRNTNTVISPVIIFQPPAIHSSSGQKEIPCRLVPLQNPINYIRIKIKFKKELGSKTKAQKVSFQLWRDFYHTPVVRSLFFLLFQNDFQGQNCSNSVQRQTWKLCTTNSKNRLQLLKEFRQLLEKDHFAIIFPLSAWGLVFDVADFKWICEYWPGEAGFNTRYYYLVLFCCCCF